MKIIDNSAAGAEALAQLKKIQRHGFHGQTISARATLHRAIKRSRKLICDFADLALQNGLRSGIADDFATYYFIDLFDAAVQREEELRQELRCVVHHDLCPWGRCRERDEGPCRLLVAVAASRGRAISAADWASTIYARDRAYARDLVYAQPRHTLSPHWARRLARKERSRDRRRARNPRYAYGYLYYRGYRVRPSRGQWVITDQPGMQFRSHRQAIEWLRAHSALNPCQ